MDYICRYKSCRPIFSKTLEGLASAAVIKTLVLLDKKSSQFEQFLKQILYYAGFLKNRYTYTVILKRSVFEIRDVDEEFRYFKVELVDILFTDLIRVVQSFYIKKIFFVNNRAGMASLTCAKHEKNVPSLEFFLWTSSISL